MDSGPTVSLPGPAENTQSRLLFTFLVCSWLQSKKKKKKETVFLRQVHGETCVPAAAAGGDEPLWEETGRRVLVFKGFSLTVCSGAAH